MRKAQKELAKNLIKLLEQAHDRIRNDIEKQDVQSALMLLADCQEKAIELGTMIEKSEGDGLKAVSMLEEYCEMAYQIYDKLLNGGEVGANKAYKTLRQQIVRVSNSVANDIAVKKEVVFIPYKASMWDSLESVWRAADADAECDAYVVPIPYYDKNPDGSLKEWHYEIDEYPKDVPVVDYREYDFEERHPDIIYFHNPYDNYNLVTSVEPFFYTENLRKYADKLVYIPYFVLGESMYESMCVTQGTLSSNIVIAHSEAAKEDYIRHMKKSYMRNTDIREAEIENILQKKILPLGSPKIDKVVNGKREDYELPEEWKKKLDGKKAVLYNTGVSGILNGNEQELKKIKDTISFFAKRDDVVLWWRPHPLAGATVQTMRNYLFDEYLAIIEDYKKSGIGIFDDTADLHRAVIWTDMYYGDDSSVIYLYGVQGKPIVRQNVYCLMEEDTVDGTDMGIRYRISCQVEECLYFFAWEYNRLYKLNLSDGRIVAVADAPNEQQMEPSLYSGMFYCDRALWLVPSRAHALAAYHLDTDEWEQYELPDRIKSWSWLEDKIYMLSSDYKSMWFMDIYERRLERKEICYQKKEKLRLSDEYYNNDLYLKDGKIYYLITHTNILAIYDLERGQAELMHIGLETNQYQRMAYDGSCFWLLPGSDKIGVVCWDGKNVKESDADGYPKEFSAPFGFLNFAFRDSDILLFPYRGNKILCIDKNTMKITCSLKANQIFNAEIVDIDNVIMLSDNKMAVSVSKVGEDSCIAIIDNSCKTLVQYPIICLAEKHIDYSRIFERLEEERYNSTYAYQISEGNIYTLKRACDALIKSEHAYSEMKSYFRSLYANSDGTAGVHIWEEVKEC